jgi:Toprim-like
VSWHRIKPPQKCVCSHHDWCLINDDGSEFLCMRESSSRPLQLSDGQVGWIHGSDNRRVHIFRKPEPKAQHLSVAACEEMLAKATAETTLQQIRALSDQLGLKVSSLLELKVAFAKWTEKAADGRSRSYAAWLFPMRDGNGNLVGFRARDWTGNKWSVRGSRNALFWPWVEPEEELWVGEGATDALALRQLGCFAVGRPSCSGGLLDLKTMTASLGCSRAYIIADNDQPGIDGAKRLAEHLPIPCAILTLPTKDVREALKMGLNYQLLMALTNTAIWRTH